MKMFRYKEEWAYGAVIGVLFANNVQEAKEIFLKNKETEHARDLLYDDIMELEFEEIDTTKQKVIDFSWSH